MMDLSSNCPSLPDDLIIKILLRLPVKSLLQFKSVCKNWLALIESPNFINKHFHHKSNHANLLVYWHGFTNPNPYDHTHTFTLFLDETLKRREEPKHLKMPGVITQYRGKIHGPCKGIFFLVNAYNEMALWNPATRRMRQLPCFPDPFPESNEIAFWVDPLTDEFKIVVINAEPMSPYFYLYSSGNDSWKLAKSEALGIGDPMAGYWHVYVPENQGGAVFLDGFFYWRKFFSDEFSVILAFDIHKEVFEEIEIPNIIGSRNKVDLAIYNDSLTILSYDGDGYLDVRERIDIWVMKEKGCWTRLSTVITPFQIRWTLGFWKNHEIFLLNKDYELILWNLDTDNTKNLRIGKRGFCSGRKTAPFYYKESLVSVKVGGHNCQDFDMHSAEIESFFSYKMVRN